LVANTAAGLVGGTGVMPGGKNFLFALFLWSVSHTDNEHANTFFLESQIVEYYAGC
jgi:hypothetical protein